MKTAVVGILVAVIALSARSRSGDDSYYAEIQSGETPLSAEEFTKLEADALSGFASSAAYLPLVKAFASTSERVWAVIYGEVFVNLSTDDALQKEIGALVFQLYDDAITEPSPGQLAISLTRQKLRKGDTSGPFALNFEISVVYSLMTSDASGAPAQRAGLEPLTIRALTDTRRQQLVLWREKELPVTELVRWQERVAEAGHFDAYNFSLFRAARPDEFAEWLGAHEAEHKAWTQWQGKHPMKPATPDFQRIHMRDAPGP